MLARLHTSRQFQEFGSPTDRSPLLLRLVVITIFAIPANMVFAPLGAVGYVSMVLAIVLFALWLLSALMGLHDPIPFRHPGRLGLGALWLATVIAYVAMGPGPADSIGRASADRWLLIMLGVTGVAMVTAESTRTESRRLSLVRTLVGGMTLCSVIAIYQFITHTDPDLMVRPFLVGLSDNGGNTTLQAARLFSSRRHHVSPHRTWRGGHHDPADGDLAGAVRPDGASMVALVANRCHRVRLVYHCVALCHLGTLRCVSGRYSFPSRAGPQWASFVVPAGIIAVFSAVPDSSRP